MGHLPAGSLKTGLAAPALRTDDSVAARRRGIVLVATAPLCWSLGGMLVRLTEAPAWSIVFWRSFFLALTLVVVLAVRYGRNLPVALVRVGWQGVLAGAFLAGAFVFFVLALDATEVANVLAIQGTAPLFAALLAWAVLGERLRLRTWFVMAAVIAGLLIMFANGIAGGRIVGDLLALGIAIVIACHVVVLRGSTAADMTPAVLYAALFSALLALALGWPVPASGPDIGIAAVLGAVQLGLGGVLFTMGARHVPAAETSLLMLLEMVFGTLWVWLFLAERPATPALVGGCIVLAALAANAGLALRERET